MTPGCGAGGTEEFIGAGGRGVGFGGDVDAAQPVTNEGMGDGAGEGIAYVGYGPGPLKSLFTFCSNSASAVGSTLSYHSR